MFKLFKKKDFEPDDDAIRAVADGKMILPCEIKDAVFSGELMGQTIGIIPENGKVVSPISGTLEVMYPTGHAFAVRGMNGVGILVHIGIDTVTLNGKGFKILKKQGDSVIAGENVVTVDLHYLQESGIDSTIMIVETEPGTDGKIKFIDPCEVKRNQIISM